MEWVKLYTRYYCDPKVSSLPDADSEMLFVRSLAYAGEQETGGFIPAGTLPLLARRRRYETSVRALLAATLWTRVQGGYQITRWHDRQEELEALAERRRADRERKRRQREREKLQVSGLSRDLSAGQSRDCHAPKEEEKELPPNPAENGGESRDACDYHRRTIGRRHANCRACGTNPRAKRKPPPKPADRTVADIFTGPTCEHGAPLSNGQVTCALCRRKEAG